MSYILEEENQDFCRVAENMVQRVLDGCHVCLLSYGRVEEQNRAPMEEKNGRDDRSMLSSLLFDVHKKIRLLIKSNNKCCTQIFEKVENLKSTGWLYMLSASLLEVNHDRVTDLLRKCLEKDKATNPTNFQNISHTHMEGFGRTTSKAWKTVITPFQETHISTGQRICSSRTSKIFRRS